MDRSSSEYLAVGTVVLTRKYCSTFAVSTGLSCCYKKKEYYHKNEGNNIDVVQNVSCHFEQSEKSRRVHWQSSCVRSLGASLCRDDTIDEILVLVDNCYIIS